MSGQTSGANTAEVKVSGCDTTTAPNAPESTGSQSNANTVTNDASSGGAPAYAIPADRQAVFDRVYTGLRAQGRPAYDDVECRCRYLTDDGAKCAIGLLLPEGHPAQSCVADVACVHDDWPELFEDYDRDARFLARLQACHDLTLLNGSGVSDETWWALCERNLRKLASEYGLTVPA